MRVHPISATLLLLLAGCTSAPQFHAVQNDAVIARPPAETWQRLVAFAADHNLPVTIASEAGGTLQATLPTDAVTRYADCGETHSVTLPDPQGTVTVQLTPATGGTKANARVIATDRMYSSAGISRDACTSRGTLEAEILAALR